MVPAVRYEKKISGPKGVTGRGRAIVGPKGPKGLDGPPGEPGLMGANGRYGIPGGKGVKGDECIPKLSKSWLIINSFVRKLLQKGIVLLFL